MMLSSNTITFLVTPFLVLRDKEIWAKDLLPGTVFALIKSTFSEELFTTSVVLPCVGGSVKLLRDSPVFCSSGLYILVDVSSSVMIILPWNSIPCNFCNSFCTCSGITAKPNPLYSHFSQSVSQHDNFSATMWLHWSQKVW